jgi:hypothetical protein
MKKSNRKKFLQFVVLVLFLAALFVPQDANRLLIAGIALIGAGLICIGLGGMIVMPVIRCIWRGCVSLFNKFTNFVHRFVSSKAVA